MKKNDNAHPAVVEKHKSQLCFPNEIGFSFAINTDSKLNEPMTFETSFLFAALLLFLSVVTSKLLGGLGIPSLIVFLALGMVAGSEGLGGIYFDNALLAQSLGTVALIYILFSGGLDTNFKKIKPILGSGLVLSSFGVILTTGFTAIFVHYVLDWGVIESLLIGSIVSSTDAAAVFASLRSKTSRLKNNLGPLLELESGSNDPMAVALTLLCIQLLGESHVESWSIALKILGQFLIGGIWGYLSARIMTFLFNRIRLEYEGLYPVFSLALVMLVYLIGERIKANGFLAVYICAIFLSNQSFVSKRTTMIFHDGVAWLMQIAMFITLGLLVFPSRLPPIAPQGLFISAFLIFIARPASVFLSLHFSSFSLRDKLLISWVGLRGSVPIILATFPYVAHIAKADLIFNIVFFIVITSVLVQGATIRPVAQFLGLMEEPPNTNVPEKTSTDIFEDMDQYRITKGSPYIGKNIVDLQLPEGVLVIFIQRRDEKIIPRGSTVLEADDNLLLVASEAQKEHLHAMFKPV